MRRYQLEIAAAAALYVGLVFISTGTVNRLAGNAKVAIALLPVLGVTALVIAIVRFVLRADELERQVVVMSAALAAVGVGVMTMALGFLENAGVPRLSMTLVWPLLAVAFGVTFPFVHRRYQ